MSRVSLQLSGIVIFVGAVVLGGCLPADEPPPTAEQMVERGQYLVNLGGCNDCHSPKVFAGGMPSPDPKRLLSGHPQDAELPAYSPDQVGPGEWVLFTQDLTAAVGPWGVSFAANLTPDEDTGLGDWTIDEFIATMQTGTHRGIGRPILPPMPWFSLAMVSEDDLRAIFAYLQSIPAVSNEVPMAIEPAPMESD
jgi:mono/diheme cytochrome c family protein